MCVANVLYSTVPVTVYVGHMGGHRLKPKLVMVNGFLFFIMRDLVRQGLGLGHNCRVGAGR